MASRSLKGFHEIVLMWVHHPLLLEHPEVLESLLNHLDSFEWRSAILDPDFFNLPFWERLLTAGLQNSRNRQYLFSPILNEADLYTVLPSFPKKEAMERSMTRHMQKEVLLKKSLAEFYLPSDWLAQQPEIIDWMDQIFQFDHLGFSKTSNPPNFTELCQKLVDVFQMNQISHSPRWEELLRKFLDRALIFQGTPWQESRLSKIVVQEIFGNERVRSTSLMEEYFERFANRTSAIELASVFESPHYLESPVVQKYLHHYFVSRFHPYLFVGPEGGIQFSPNRAISTEPWISLEPSLQIKIFDRAFSEWKQIQDPKMKRIGVGSLISILRYSIPVSNPEWEDRMLKMIPIIFSRSGDTWTFGEDNDYRGPYPIIKDPRAHLQEILLYALEKKNLPKELIQLLSSPPSLDCNSALH